MGYILRNILAVIVGILVGGTVNMALVVVSGHIIPPPEGTDVSSIESLQASIPLFEPKHFLFPFLAHALGTLVGALVASLIAASRRLLVAMLVGVFFMMGGLANVLVLPSPAWFSALDLLGAYLPMAWLGWRLSGRKR